MPQIGPWYFQDIDGGYGASPEYAADNPQLLAYAAAHPDWAKQFLGADNFRLALQAYEQKGIISTVLATPQSLGEATGGKSPFTAPAASPGGGGLLIAGLLAFAFFASRRR